MSVHLNQYLEVYSVFLVGVFLIKAHFHLFNSCVIMKGVRNMRKKTKISLEEHNDNFMLLLIGSLSGMAICAAAHLFVNTVLR